ncbi:XRE family transcriptional regulator [Duganella sp. BJB488]|uniref:helix-turn-helix domain-containing protein n=1 Tax=unclassified Duganella TaxID=2636909 RepID=UPI000E34160F|nr:MULTISPECIES: helix-turn-helix transcriptional regulator [unclassified Duganella]RFP24554.1 XRE family transcriptional regulator [Duganella sp. BJB489]RFP26914.1 XRE family transcriptional regulator [Duganella sp. BJB488]RFP34353.1 XRE family transcriptional regulator [Duganella sp. BJB480]
MKLSAFGLCVRKLRLELGLTLRDMATAVGVSSPYLSSIELGERTLTSKIAENAIIYFENKNVGKDQISELRIACDQSFTAVPVSALQADERNLVAAFARRLTEGHGVPNDVLNWLNGGTVDGQK